MVIRVNFSKFSRGKIDIVLAERRGEWLHLRFGVLHTRRSAMKGRSLSACAECRRRRSIGRRDGFLIACSERGASTK